VYEMLFQPTTTDVTPAGLMRARNSMRIMLWNDSSFAHRWLCHPARECEDGCEGGFASHYDARLALYQSELEGLGHE